MRSKFATTDGGFCFDTGTWLLWLVEKKIRCFASRKKPSDPGNERFALDKFASFQLRRPSIYPSFSAVATENTLLRFMSCQHPSWQFWSQLHTYIRFVRVAGARRAFNLTLMETSLALPRSFRFKKFFASTPTHPNPLLDALE